MTNVVSLEINRVLRAHEFGELLYSVMALVEETANYLVGPGRKERQRLAKKDIVTYEAEALRLTTRLMGMVTYVLLVRSLKEGEEDETSYSVQRRKIQLHVPQGDIAVSPKLPERLLALHKRSLKLFEELVKADKDLAQAVSQQEKAIRQLGA